jgi:hypothetical protein
LPRFEHPVAVVVPFMARLFDRNLDRDRPHLDPALRWHAGDKPPLRLVELARRATRYRGRGSIEEGVAMTRAALRASLALARARGARAIVLVPQFLPEEDGEREVRREVLDEATSPICSSRSIPPGEAPPMATPMPAAPGPWRRRWPRRAARQAGRWPKYRSNPLKAASELRGFQ